MIRENNNSEQLIQSTEFVNQNFEISISDRDEIVDEIESFLYRDEENIPSTNVVLKCLLIYSFAKSFGFETEPHLNLEGTVTLILSIDDRFIDVEISENEYFKTRYEIGKGRDYKVVWKDKILDFPSLEELLIQINLECQTSLSGSLGLMTTASKKEDSEMTLLLKSTKEAFPFSPKTAQTSTPQQGFALT